MIVLDYGITMDRESIRKFVRKTLGCTCPNDVFQYIECQADVVTGGGIVLDYEINVGNRLLIYVVGVDKGHDLLRDVVSHLIQVGTEQRDEHRFNRFRLVLLAASPRSIEGRASDIFSSLSPDDKVHLHVIGQDEFDRMG